MQRILHPRQIEAFAQRTIPRIRLPDRDALFARRARRLRQLSESAAIGHSIGDYLRLMAALADAQQATLASFEVPPPEAAQLAQARAHRMPLIQATSGRRDAEWTRLLARMCASVGALPGFPLGVRDLCNRIGRSPPAQLETQADALLAMRLAEVDLASAPFVMAALQVYWIGLASRFTAKDVTELDVPGVCPMCGTLPVASVVRTDSSSQGYRYLHCALCATEWHMVRVKCSHCQAGKAITYHSIEGGPESIRAESCDDCRTYLKILYQERDPDVDPVADDLASIALDLLLSEAGYHRRTGNPLLWQHS